MGFIDLKNFDDRKRRKQSSIHPVSSVRLQDELKKSDCDRKALNWENLPLQTIDYTRLLHFRADFQATYREWKLCIEEARGVQL